jgi:tetratricopeptide (TPR) repeat protein
MTYAQFVDALVTGDADGAMERIRDLRGIEPEHILLEDSTLYRLDYSLLYRWGLGDEALEVSKMNVELNPSSALAAQGLSMSYVDRGDYAAAIDVYRRFLARNPDDESARRTLQWLEGQLERSRSRN